MSAVQQPQALAAQGGAGSKEGMPTCGPQEGQAWPVELADKLDNAVAGGRNQCLRQQRMGRRRAPQPLPLPDQLLLLGGARRGGRGRDDGGQFTPLMPRSWCLQQKQLDPLWSALRQDPLGQSASAKEQEQEQEQTRSHRSMLNQIDACSRTAQ